MLPRLYILSTKLTCVTALPYFGIVYYFEIFDVSNLGSLMESRKSFGKVLLGFGDEIERELSDPWSRMTLLVIIAGEFVAAALAKKVDRESEVLELCSTAAEDLCSRMMKLSELRSWVSVMMKCIYVCLVI